MKNWKYTRKHIYNKRDVILFALGIGCTEMKYIYENDSRFQAFPTMPLTLLFRNVSHDIWDASQVKRIKDSEKIFKLPTSPKGGTRIDAYRILEILKPLPTGGDILRSTSKLKSIQQKRNGAFFETATEIRSSNDDLLYHCVSGVYISKVKGLESKGKQRFNRIKLPSSAPDLVLHKRVSQVQHALFRLSGDYNPLHIDSEFAKAVGFEKPILHGLCTFGICVQALLAKHLGLRVRKLGVRFTSPVLPGQILEIRAWKSTSLKTTFLTMVAGQKVLEGFIEFFAPSTL